MGGRTGIPAGIVDRRTIADGMLAEMGFENRGQLLEQIYGKKYDPAADVTDQRSQVPPQLLAQPSGKALTSLSLPPPLPPPPPPPPPPAPVTAEPPKPGEPVEPPKPGEPVKPAAAVAKPVPAKEALLDALNKLTEAVGSMGARNGKH